MEDIGCLLVVAVIGGLGILLFVFLVRKSSQERGARAAERAAYEAAQEAARAEYAAAQEAARRAYQEALGQLKNHPANPEVRERALSLGRTCAAYMRNPDSVTLFDEVALMNDINAACAAAFAARPPASIEDRLTRLHDLRARGLISEGEYDERRREILRDT